MAIADAGRVLVCLRYGIGDVVMQLPALSALRAAARRAHITAVGAEPAIELLADGRLADRVLSVHRFGIGHWGDKGDEIRRSAIVRWIGEERFDAVLDPSQTAIGFGRSVWESGHHAIFDSGNGTQEAEFARGCAGYEAVNAAVRRGWGLELPLETPPRIELNPSEQRFALDFLARHGLARHRPVAVAPLASSPLKCWPIVRLARAVESIAGRVPVLVFAADDNSVLTAWQPLAAGFPWITVPRLNLRHTAALLQRCRLLVCNDTGLMHLAASAGIPGVAVFGPTSADIYCPPGMQAAAADLPCPHRRVDAFGPPECVVAGMCLMGERSCIDRVTVADVVSRATAADAELSKRTGGEHAENDRS